MTSASPKIAIIGAGPAGATCARLLSEAGATVAIWEYRQEPKERFPEAIARSAYSLLSRLCVDEFLNENSISYDGIIRRTPEGRVETESFSKSGWIINRKVFDVWLRSQASKVGVIWHFEQLQKAEYNGSTWTLFGNKTKASADYIVDATGRSGFVSRHLGKSINRGCRTIAIGIRTPLSEIVSNYLYTEDASSGWWYSLGDSVSRFSVFVTRDLTIERSKHSLFNQLGKSEWAIKMRECFSEWSSLYITDASSQCRTASGNGWLALGDAASSYDPISSQGLVNALSSAWFGSQAIADCIRGDNDALSIYADAMYSTWIRTFQLQEDHYYKNGN